jgi:hypothetical protein
MSQPNRDDRRRKALPETRSRRNASAAVSPYFIDDMTMTLSEWRSGRDHELVTVIGD